MAKLIDKKVKKLTEGKCYFCKNEDYAVLDVHRIVPEEKGGRYVPSNVVICCACCHRRVHDGQIVIDRWYPTSAGRDVLHFWESEEEKWE
jgi:hypothetical protein